MLKDKKDLIPKWPSLFREVKIFSSSKTHHISKTPNSIFVIKSSEFFIEIWNRFSIARKSSLCKYEIGKLFK